MGTGGGGGPSSGSSSSTGAGGPLVIGDPCTPPDEFDPAFAGFKVTEYGILPGLDQCPGGVCLLNHFQGRVTCPFGQAAPTPCTGPDDTSCVAGACVPACAPDVADCQQFVCHVPGDCQEYSNPMEAKKGCCVPGTDEPVATAVCGQCAQLSHRSGPDAVFCTCRCGLADGAPDTGAPLCDCPKYFECAEIKPYLGPGDEDTAGKYCIHENTDYTAYPHCGQEQGGYYDATCASN